MGGKLGAFMPENGLYWRFNGMVYVIIIHRIDKMSALPGTAF